MRISDWIYHNLGDEWGGNPCPPGSAQTLRFGELEEPGGKPMYVADTGSNDGHDLYIGYRHKWLFHCCAEDARNLAWFILWDWWIVGTWCGLKRKIWYWALHQKVERMKSTVQEMRRNGEL